MEITWLLIDQEGTPIVEGAADTSLMVRRSADGYLLDWDDLSFKASGWTTPATTFDEIDAVNLAGYYGKEITISGWDDGLYQFIAAYVTIDVVARGDGDLKVKSGTDIDSYMGDRVENIDGPLSDVANDVWAVATRALTDKAGFTISGTKTTLDALNDIPAGTVMGKSPASLAAADVSGNLPADVVDWKGAAAPAMTGDAYAAVGDLNDATQGATKSELDAAQLVVTNAIAALHNATQGATAVELAAAQLVLTNAIAALNNATQGATKGELDAAQAAIEGAMPSVAGLALEDNVETHMAAALATYDPPTGAEATADKQAVLDALASAGITVEDILAGDLADNETFPAGSLGDRIRKLFWVLCNRMVITDASGAFTAYKDDGVTPALTGTVVDNGQTTARTPA